jgi:hypothetical protein
MTTFAFLLVGILLYYGRKSPLGFRPLFASVVLWWQSPARLHCYTRGVSAGVIAAFGFMLAFDPNLICIRKPPFGFT